MRKFASLGTLNIVEKLGWWKNSTSVSGFIDKVTSLKLQEIYMLLAKNKYNFPLKEL